MKILLFEDKAETNQLLTNQLEEHEYDVVSEITLLSAVKWLKEGNIPDLALLDIVDDRSRPTHLNKINSGGEEAGFFLASMLKEIDINIPIIFFTAFGREKHIKEGAEKYSPVEFFDKGGDENLELGQSVMEEILKKIDLVMEKRRLLRKWEEHWSQVEFGKISIIKKQRIEKQYKVDEIEHLSYRDVYSSLFKEIDNIVYVQNLISYDSDFIEIELTNTNEKESTHTLFDLFSNFESKPSNVNLIIVIEQNGEFYEMKNDAEKLVIESIKKLKTQIYLDRFNLKVSSQEEFKEWILGTNLKKINKSISSWLNKNNTGKSKAESYIESTNISTADNFNIIKKLFDGLLKDLRPFCNNTNLIEEITGLEIIQKKEVRADRDKTFQINISTDGVCYYYPIASQCLYIKFFNDIAYPVDYITLSSFFKQISIYYTSINKANPFILLKRGFLVNGFRIEYLDKWSHEGKECYSAGLYDMNEKNEDLIRDIQIQNAGYNRAKEYFPTLRKEKNPGNF